MKNKRNKSFINRGRFISGGLLFGLTLVMVRSACLQIEPRDDLAYLGEQQFRRDVTVPASRGDIFDRRGKLLAGSVDVYSIYADPRSVDPNDAKGLARQLSKLLDEDFDKLYQRLVSDRSFVWVKRQQTPEVRDAILALNNPGLGVRKEPKRYYPERELASQIIGFTNVDTEGLAGIERALDHRLAGEPQIVEMMRDARGRYILFDAAQEEASKQGRSVTLTIDSAIQHAAEEAVREQVAAYKAKAGLAIVLGVERADLLAVAVEPNFNPNRISDSKASERRNRAFSDMFEPGSTMKPLVVAAALEAGAVAENAIFFCEEGSFEVGGHKIRDAKPYGWMGLKEIVQKSSNIGLAKIGKQLGRVPLARALEDLGFGSRTGIQFPGETSGLIRDPKTWSEIGLANIAFGHGVAVSALQLASAYRVLAAEGRYRAPRLVESIRGPEEDEVFPLAEERRVFSAATVAAVLPMIIAAAGPEGTGARAQIPGYRVAGKTGTAQKLDPVSGGYSRDAHIAVFAGLVPAHDPSAVIVVAIDEPRPDHGGGVVAAPVFASIAEATMRELGRVPEEGLLAATVEDVVPEAAQPVITPAETETVEVPEGGLPSFVGLTAREAVERYRELALRGGLELRGSGVVVSQSPRPGAEPSQVLALTMKPPGEEP